MILASVVPGLTAVVLSLLFAGVVGPRFRDLILRHEDEWRSEIDPAGAHTPARANSSDGLNAVARRRA